MAKAANLVIDVVAKVDQAVKGLSDLKDKASDSLGTVKTVAAGFAAGIGAELGVATKAAMDHETHVAKLSQTYANVGAPAADMAKALDEIDASARRTGQSADDNIDAFDKLMVATKDSHAAMTELGTAQDLAAFKGVSVSDATNAIIKASEGNTKALKAMGIETTDTAGKQLSAQAIMDNLTKAVHGQADAFGDTAAGKVARFHESLDQMQVKIGEAVLPALNSLLDVLAPILDFFTRHQAIISVLVPVLGGLAVAITAVNVATKIWTASQAALDVVMDANPVVLLALAIAGLVAGIVIAYQKFQPFHDMVDAVGRVLKGVGDWVLANWKIIIDVLLGPLGILLTNFDKVIGAVRTMIDWLGRVKQAASDAFGWLGKVTGALGGALSHIPGLGGLSVAPAAAGTPVFISIQVAPGDDFADAVYRGLRSYQRRHRRPELAALFG
jgi:hypothetical protein